MLYYLHFQPHHSRFFHKSIEKKKIINSMWCQFHEQIYQEFPVGIPRRFFLCEELLYTWHSSTTKFFFEKRICTTPRQGKKESFVPQMSSKKEKKFLEKRKKFIQFFFFTFQKKCFSHHLPLGPRSALVFKKEVMHE